jgi:hypothetical protein
MKDTSLGAWMTPPPSQARQSMTATRNGADYNTVLGVVKPISETKDTAVMVATSKDGHVRYEVKLRKYSWLLHSAKKWQWMIWLPAQVERTECPIGPH